ncbi:adenine-specific DNA-methyltransferase [Candidatus Pantoea carbekii]|uniref:Site-specific DNA-methyltransferase (adenine-specific) n=1 Tax=Candidatus Pantoea carbekii TaxID=1235990 RepID=U3U7G4_9GAMM|nr:adenine-specific DNA-methyltransferase [Candidatus Pantoea carbekii]AKC32456.1 DNA adenine methylase Dam [Candidatus Pantoea carbekii]BAO00184.1 Dam protein [Candidatus Pantoea carbekii]
MKKNRAFLKWAGGKYLLIDDIRPYLPPGECLIEPFVGSGSIFLNTDYKHYHLADINGDLINLYNIVKTCTIAFIKDARKLFTANANTAKNYYAYRTTFNSTQDTYQRALLFLYLNRHSYNGLCRYNLNGKFNVPFGRYYKPYFPEDELLSFAEHAQKATFVCESYDVTLKRAYKGSVVYCDPPYVPLSATSNFTAYYTNRFSVCEQLNLAELASKLAKENRIPVIISNHDTLLTRQWYQHADLHVIKAKRSISRSIRSRTEINELLALFY